MGRTGKRDVKRTHSLFIDDLKVSQENHKKLEVANEVIACESKHRHRCMLWSKEMRRGNLRKMEKWLKERD